ncbi:rhodanese-like domain-containing protein [Haloparvum sp. PAK95]|uniref:rhodanese-like domain-containing protein n=1 Tax=Haloparvum sp. PAK95 TaxID=3418962 RepID=UPI003D2F0AA9
MTNTIITPAEVESRNDVFVLDVRPAYSFEEEHIVGSHNLPIYDQLKGKNFIGLDASTAELPKDEEIAVVCFSGSTAGIAAERLRDQGFDAKRLVGGIAGWEAGTAGTVQAAQSV